MQQIKRTELICVLKSCGYQHIRSTGDHDIYKRDDSPTISVPVRLKPVIAHKILKQIEGRRPAL